ncbi:MAG TPA: type II toxin-antitoxin system RelE/ParE family toxin [Pirellulaceae bacterium]|nr:type II toxin-antitoxin system RelE/ParE family toxin [Pirellulaceae bacterium]
MTFRVIVTDPAEEDADAIYIWLQHQSPRRSINWWRAFLRAIDSLRQNAQSFGLAPESTEHPDDVREFTFKTRYGRPYRLLFTIRDDVAYVLRIRSTGQPLLTNDEIVFPV